MRTAAKRLLRRRRSTWTSWPSHRRRRRGANYSPDPGAQPLQRNHPVTCRWLQRQAFGSPRDALAAERAATWRAQGSRPCVLKLARLSRGFGDEQGCGDAVGQSRFRCCRAARHRFDRRSQQIGSPNRVARVHAGVRARCKRADRVELMSLWCSRRRGESVMVWASGREPEHVRFGHRGDGEKALGGRVAGWDVGRGRTSMNRSG